MRLGTRLTLYLSLIIILVLSCYGYFHIVSRHEILTKMMKVEVRGIGETLRFSLEKLSLPQNWSYVQEFIASVSAPEQTLGQSYTTCEKIIFFTPLPSKRGGGRRFAGSFFALIFCPRDLK